MSAVIPKRTWALVWTLFALSGGFFTYLVFDGAMGNLEERYFRLDVPGSMELPHLGRGHYFVFHQFDKSRDSKEDLRPPGIERLTMSLVPLDGGEAVRLNPPGKPLRFVIRRTVSEAVYEFDITRAGGYRFNGDYPAGVSGGSFRIAIGEPYINQTLRNFMLGCAVLLVSGAIVSFILFRAGRRADAQTGEAHG